MRAHSGAALRGGRASGWAGGRRHAYAQAGAQGARAYAQAPGARAGALPPPREIQTPVVGILTTPVEAITPSRGNYEHFKFNVSPSRALIRDASGIPSFYEE